MMRARFVVAATLAGVSFAAGTLVAQQPPAPKLESVLAGKKFAPPVKGQAEIDILQPVTKREKDMVITKIQVRNMSNGPIPRLTISETWYDAGGATVGGGKGSINGLLQPGEIQTVVIETPYNAKMKANNYFFSHANGTIKTHQVAKMTDEKEPATKTTGAAKPAAKAAPKKK